MHDRVPPSTKNFGLFEIGMSWNYENYELQLTCATHHLVKCRCTTQLKQRTHRAPKPKHPDQH